MCSPSSPRIKTFGGHNLHLVQVKVTPTAAEPLVASPLIIEANKLDPTAMPAK